MLNCLGYGAYIKDGKFAVQGRALIAKKNIDQKNICVSVNAKSAAQTGIVLRYKSESSYLLAMYDRQNGVIYFDETDKAHPFYLYEFDRLSEQAAGDMGESVRLTASVEENKATLTVSDGEKTVTATHDITKITESGSAGVILCPSRPQPLILDGEFDDFGLDGGFGEGNEDWNILWNYWGDGTKNNMAPHIDGLSWHPIQRDARCSADGTIMDRDYFGHVKSFKKDCEALGFKGDYMASEIYVGAVYPASGPYEGMTEFQMAKYLLQSLVGHNSLDIESGPCHPHFTSFPHPQSLCRVPHPAQIINPCQPTPSYYAWRNAATAMDDFYEFGFPVSFSGDEDILYFTLRSGDKNRLMLALWLDLPPADEFRQKTVDIFLEKASAKNCSAADLFNGTLQKLNFELKNGGTFLQGIYAKDYPIVIYFDI
jgi:hypothetical protein